MSKLKLKRELGLFDGLMVGLGAGMGIEIFILLNYAADFEVAGSAVMSALFLSGLANLLTMLSYSELGAAIPEVGGEYTYTKAAYGGLLAFLAGWFRWVSSVLGAALAALGFAIYARELFSSFISLNIPLTAIIIVFVFTVLSIRGIEKPRTIIPVALIIVFGVFILGGLLYGLQPQPILPVNLGKLPGFFEAAVYTVPMFFGVRAIVASGAQMKNPDKNIPRSLILCALLMIVINLSVAYVAIGLVYPKNLVGLAGSPEPLLVMAARTVHIPPFPPESSVVIVMVAGVFAALASLTTAMMVQSSIMLGLTRDGYLPKFLLSIHHRFKTPYIAILANSLFIIIFAGTGVVVFLAYAASFGSLLVFILVNLSLMKLRKEKPYLKRPFKAPLYPVTPVAGIAAALLLMGIPIAFGEQNAESALMLAFSLVILALMTYHLRMVGYRNLRVAIGGMSLGVGGFMVLLFYLTMTESIPFTISSPLGLVLFLVLIFVCVVSILAGILNITAKSGR